MRRGSKHSIVSLAERATGYMVIGQLDDRTVDSLNTKVIQLIMRRRSHYRTITAENGTEFHGYKRLERALGLPIYFCTPYQSWERGTNENTNGLIRQNLPKGQSLADISQRDCDQIAAALNSRPRKRLGFKTPEERLCHIA